MKWDEWRGNKTPAMWIKRLVNFRRRRIDLHKFVDKDDLECFHTHPALCFRIILWGGYVEEEYVYQVDCGASYRMHHRRPGYMGFVRPEFAHRLASLPNKVSYSIWFRGVPTHKVQLLGDGWPPNAETQSTSIPKPKP